MTEVFPPLMSRILKQTQDKSMSTQGFIISQNEFRTDPSLRLLQAFATRWSGPEQRELTDFDCRYVPGRNAVSQVVRKVLTYLPATHRGPIIAELLNWVADRVAEAGVVEQWFPREFVKTVRHKQNEQETRRLNEVRQGLLQDGERRS